MYACTQAFFSLQTLVLSFPSTNQTHLSSLSRETILLKSSLSRKPILALKSHSCCSGGSLLLQWWDHILATSIGVIVDYVRVLAAFLFRLHHTKGCGGFQSQPREKS
ncbi:pentatricopeptide repeat-containing protein [Sesbania bispinosa]|nr:pentatricopeptide repeat-containing protein [Sesbania bispinosa]